MKVYIPIIFIALLFQSCIKGNDVAPTKTGVTTTTGGTPALSHNDSLHLVVFNVNNQIVKTSIAGPKLTLTLTENVNLYLTADGYAQTSAVHLLADLTHSLLAGFEFTAINEDGQIATNFVDDNLNNVQFKTITDTVVNNVKVKKINVTRDITYFRTYDTNATATLEQAILLIDVSDIITFTSYCYYNQKNYENTAVVAHVIYTQ